ncbi:MAG: hypothetical protein KDI33_16650 [Halioglobus sp.]|nr:hypothetical protein [Halioglobus sp.]
MKRLDEGKTSLVEFMRSIRYTRQNTPKSHDYFFAEQFAGFASQQRSSQDGSGKKSRTGEKRPK